MKKKVLILLGLIIVLRIINIIILNNDPAFFLSPRNFNGRGMIVMPTWLDFLIPLIIIFVLWKREVKFKMDFSKIFSPLILSTVILLTPIIIGLLLNNYIRKTFVSFEFNVTTILKYLLFILSFIAINVFADSLKFKKRVWGIIILIIGISAIAYTQDVFGSGNSLYLLLSLINSVGLSTVIFSIGLRNSYKKMPFETVLAVAVAGFFVVFFIFNALSVSFFTIFLPFIGLLTTAVVLYNHWKLRTKVVVGLLPFALALFLNYGLPKMVSPELANELIERKPENQFKVEKYGDITVKYADEKLRDIAIKFARVIDKANKITEKELGVSPRVRVLVLEGIGPGGFHAEFPDKIVGRIMSEKYIQNCNDSLFLNNPGLSPNFPDPVNGLLHEYSHLFGVIPYHKWLPGPEEEGWATYSATRLAGLLYEHDKNLWQPAYNYKAQADKITALNLSGKAVAWSHPHEFGGFILWYHIGKKWGLKKLYKLRWKYSKRDMATVSLYYLSNPQYAQRVVDVFGKDVFLKYGKYSPVSFGDLYNKDDYLYLAKTTGMDTLRIIKMYEFMRNRKIDPSVPIPQK